MYIKKVFGLNSLLFTLFQLSNVLADNFYYSVSVLPAEYGGTQVGVVVDNGPPAILSPLYNGFLWRGVADKPTTSYYYAILDNFGNIVTSEASLPINAELAGVEDLSFQREPPTDPSTSSTLNEIFGAKYTLGDSLIRGFPRLFPKRQAYSKYSLLYQEGQVPNIRAECNQNAYNTLVTSLEQEVDLNNCTLTFISPYEEIFYSDVTVSIAGMGSRGFQKRPFKIEITGADGEEDNIYNRSKFKLRNMVYDCTYIKNKVVVDMETSLSMASGQDGFARFYVNNQPFGLYDLFDPLKKKFIKQYFHEGEQDPKLGVLFKCKTNGGIRYFMEVINELNNIYTVDIVPDDADPNLYTGEEDIMELLNFINNELDTASVERVKEVIDVDLLLKTFIIEYLVDHRDGLLIGGNNFNIYRNYQTGRYHIWSYDFDATFGKYQTYPTSTTFEEYMRIPDDYTKNRPVGEVRPLYNPLAEKLFAKPEIKQEFDNLLLEITSKLFNPQAMNPRIQYLQEFLKHHMYWDITHTATLPTQKFAGIDNLEPFTLPMITQGYNGQGSTCSADSNGLYEYIDIRSKTVLNAFGSSIQPLDVAALSAEDLVGLPIESLNADSNDNDNKQSSDALRHIKTFTISTVISVILLLLF